MKYAVVIEKATSNFSAYVPDLPGCVATGATVEETEREIRAAIRNIVVVHYRATEVDTYPDGNTEGEGEEFRIIHTWMRTGDTWQIIGGMCAPLRDSPK